MNKQKSNIEAPVVERYGKIEELDRDFDIEFWQAQGIAVIFAEAWKMVECACQIKGENPHELRLQRTVESFQRLAR